MLVLRVEPERRQLSGKGDRSDAQTGRSAGVRNPQRPIFAAEELQEGSEMGGVVALQDNDDLSAGDAAVGQEKT
jgi:hypothetical protein